MKSICLLYRTPCDRIVSEAREGKEAANDDEIIDMGDNTLDHSLNIN